MSDDRYELHSKLQELTARAGVAYRSMQSFHHVAYTTFYKFIKDPEVARDRTLTSVRLVCEFLEAGLGAGVLPIPRDRNKDKREEIKRLYDHWWANNKKFIFTKVVEQDSTI